MQESGHLNPEGERIENTNGRTEEGRANCGEERDRADEARK